MGPCYARVGFKAKVKKRAGKQPPSKDLQGSNLHGFGFGCLKEGFACLRTQWMLREKQKATIVCRPGSRAFDRASALK